MTRNELKERDRNDIAAIFSTREGRRFFAKLLHQCCGIYDLMAVETPPYAAAFLNGGRNVGIAVLSWLQAADENAVVKLFEAAKERTVDEWTTE